MAIFNNLSSLIFYSLIIVTVGLIGFSVCYSINNVNNNEIDNNVDTSSNNVNSDGDTQTEELDQNLDTNNWYAYPVHEAKFRELLEILGPAMEEKRIDELCLRHTVYSYSLEELTSRSNINLIIIAQFCLRFLCR